MTKGRPVTVLNEDKRTMRFHNPTNLEMRKQGLEEIHDHSKLSTSMRTQMYGNQKQYFGYNTAKEKITELMNKFCLIRRFKNEHQCSIDG